MKIVVATLVVTVCTVQFFDAAFASETSAADAKVLSSLREGETTSLLFWTHEQQLAGFRNIDNLLPTRALKTGDYVYPLISAPRDFSGVSYEKDGELHTIDDYMVTYSGVGLIVVRNDKILLERYAHGNDENSLWVSFSVAKSVTSMLVGAAIQDGFIESVNEPITDYLPRLKHSVYDKASIRNVLQMSSGAAWNEDYADPNSDVSKAGGFSGLGLYAYLRGLLGKSKPGEKFNYNTGETNLVGSLARAAIGNNLATYATNKIWQGFGMESEASWTLNQPGGTELGGCCINATLRDYARIGIFAMHDGVGHDGVRILPEGWMAESTAPSKGFEGYGYLWWLDEDAYMALGIYGQIIFIHPATQTVIAMHSAWPAAVGEEYQEHRSALISALMKHLEVK